MTRIWRAMPSHSKTVERGNDLRSHVKSRRTFETGGAFAIEKSGLDPNIVFVFFEATRSARASCAASRAEPSRAVAAREPSWPPCEVVRETAGCGVRPVIAQKSGRSRFRSLMALAASRFQSLVNTHACGLHTQQIARYHVCRGP